MDNEVVIHNSSSLAGELIVLQPYDGLASLVYLVFLVALGSTLGKECCDPSLECLWVRAN